MLLKVLFSFFCFPCCLITLFCCLFVSLLLFHFPQPFWFLLLLRYSFLYTLSSFYTVLVDNKVWRLNTSTRWIRLWSLCKHTSSVIGRVADCLWPVSVTIKTEKCYDSTKNNNSAHSFENWAPDNTYFFLTSLYRNYRFTIFSVQFNYICQSHWSLIKFINYKFKVQ